MSSYRRMRQDTPSNGNRPADGEGRRGTERKRCECSTRAPPSPFSARLAGRRRRPAAADRPLYPLGHRSDDHGDPHRPSRSSCPAEDPCPPAPSCSSTPTRVGRDDLDGPDRRRLHRHHRRPTPTDASPKVADHQLVIIDVVTGDKSGRRHLPRDPGDARRWSRSRSCASARRDEVEERIRFLEAGADDVMAQAVRRARARGPRRGPAPPVPALEGPERGRLDRRHHRHPDPPGRRRPQPEGRRRDLDRRDEHRDGGRPAQAGSRRHRRPRPPVRPGRDPPEHRAAPDPGRRRPRRRGDCASRSSSGPTRPGTTAASTSSPPRPGPELAELVTRRARRPDPDDPPRHLRPGRDRHGLVARRADADARSSTPRTCSSS